MSAARLVGCGGCPTRWRQRGNRTGHCARCHRTFDSLEAFDAHQSTEDDRMVCADPSGMKKRDGTPRLSARIEDGVTYWTRRRQPGRFDKVRQTAA